MRGLSHSNLDWIGLSEQFAEFRLAFQAQLKLENPNIKPDSKVTKASPQISMLAHLEDFGDAYFTEGALIENTGRRSGIEGLLIASAMPEQIQIEYMGHIARQGDTAWMPAGTYLGTWGQKRSLEGVAIRLSGAGAEKWDIVYQARAGEKEWLPSCSNGQFCGTRDQDKAITALRIQILPKSNSM